MTIYKRAQGGIRVEFDEPGCPEFYEQVTFGSGPEGWTEAEPPAGRVDQQHFCPEHSPSAGAEGGGGV